MKKITILFFIALSLVSFTHTPDVQSTPKTITVSGRVSQRGSGSITIREVSPTDKGAEFPVPLNADNTFKKSLTITQPGYYQMQFFGQQVATFILDKNSITIDVDTSSPQGKIEIKGSPDSDLIHYVQKEKDFANLPEMKKIEAEFQEVMQVGNHVRANELQNEAQKLMQTKTKAIADYVRKQPASLGLLYVLQNFFNQERDQYFDLFLATEKKMVAAYPQSRYTKEFSASIKKLKKIAIGQPAPEIAQPNPEGKIVKLSSFRGKYVLIDFWAKWCGPCRQENPNVVRAYQQYKSKGFEVFGVSLDRNKQDWVRAIAEDGITYTQVSDLNYFSNAAAVEYNVEAIPYSILVDPKGIIVAKNLRGPSLENKLREIFGNE